MCKYLKFPSYVLFGLTVAALYAYYGAAGELSAYYAPSQCEVRKNQHLLRPMYAQLQRELVKSKLNLPFALDNLDLIIHFATINSKLGAGMLPVNVKSLLEAVLRTIPQQVTALNLLAIDAYKRDKLQESVNYWRQIIVLASPERLDTQHVRILRKKVEETEAKIAEFERIQTKM